MWCASYGCMQVHMGHTDRPCLQHMYKAPYSLFHWARMAFILEGRNVWPKAHVCARQVMHACIAS